MKNCKKISKIVAHIIFWILTLYFFLNYSFLHPCQGNGYYKELICIGMLITITYFNYFFLYPFFFKKRGVILYVFFSLVSVGVIALLEILLYNSTLYFISISENFEISIRNYYKSLYLLLFFRDAAFLIFFMLLKFYQDTLEKCNMEKKMAELERQNFALKEEKYEIENQYLRSKITPHYLVNVVNSLQARAIKKTDDLPNLIAKLSAVLEYYMIFSSKEQVDINEEIIFYKNFIDLEILRHKEPLLLSFNVINIPKNCMIPPLLFENMIANAFKFVPQDESGYIKILFEFHDPNSLIFSCENNRWNNEINYQKHGTGLRNMEKRLKLLFGSAFMLTTTNLKDSFFIRLELKNLDKIKKECR